MEILDKWRRWQNQKTGRDWLRNHTQHPYSRARCCFLQTHHPEYQGCVHIYILWAFCSCCMGEEGGSLRQTSQRHFHMTTADCLKPALLNETITSIAGITSHMSSIFASGLWAQLLNGFPCIQFSWCFLLQETWRCNKPIHVIASSTIKIHQYFPSSWSTNKFFGRAYSALQLPSFRSPSKGFLTL